MTTQGTAVTSNSDLTIGDFLEFLMPGVTSGAKPFWPPDAFALASSLLRRSGAYKEIANRRVSGAIRSPEAWHKFMCGISKKWEHEYLANAAWPREIDAWWREVVQSANDDLSTIAGHTKLFNALVKIIAASDHTCDGFGFFEFGEGSVLQDLAFRNLAIKHSLCDAIHHSRVIVMPKAHNPLTGTTVRSLTHNLALWDKAEVFPRWEKIRASEDKSGINVLLLPWPLSVDPERFRSTKDHFNVMLPPENGFFLYDVPETISAERVLELLEEAERLVGYVDMVVLPELSMSRQSFDALHYAVEPRFLIAGIGNDAQPGVLGTNEVAVAVDRTRVAGPFLQGKHHRWRLDPFQVNQYGLGRGFDDRKCWWEAIHVENRICRFFSSTDWLTFCVLICEDLARQDPMAELVRSVGPSLVIALLLDGPQIATRWPARYATVLAEDPRSAVLTLTSAGVVDLSRSQYGGGERSIGLWKEAKSPAPRQIILDAASDGVVLCLDRDMDKEWTIDCRHDNEQSGYLRLASIHQVALPAKGSRVAKRKPKSKGHR